MDGDRRNPDWRDDLRYIDVESRATSQDFTPLGDPARWGGREAVVVGPLGTFADPGLIRVQTFDPYSRLWSLLGTLSAPADVWALDSTEWQATLEVAMGAGQTTVVHRFNLRALVALAAPWYAVDLVTKPWVVTGGVIARAYSARVVHTLNTDAFNDTRIISGAALTTPLAAGSEI